MLTPAKKQIDKCDYTKRKWKARNFQLFDCSVLCIDLKIVKNVNKNPKKPNERLSWAAVWVWEKENIHVYLESVLCIQKTYSVHGDTIERIYPSTWEADRPS